MKHNKTFRWKRLLSGLWICLFLASSTIAFAGDDDSKRVGFEGKWQEGARSLSFEYPVSATFDELNLYIESTSMRSDIVIRIWDGTDLIVETGAPAETLPVTIPISHLEKGTLYRLELTNQWGDCLNGTFQL